MRGYRTADAHGEAAFVIHRSRFIGRCYPVAEEANALEQLNALRKQHWDASHNCYAYILGPRGEVARFSDDGEPGGTAGMPMLEVLKANGLTNTLVVATRYFGGVLLGAGGLVRAYSRAAADAVAAAGVAELLPAQRLLLQLDYRRYGLLESYLRQNARLEDIRFAQDVTIEALVEDGAAGAFIAAVTERTDGRCIPAPVGEALLRRRLTK